MTTVLLIRHALTDAVGRTLAGRSPGHHLNAEGRVQADRLADRLARELIARLYTSPLERARETAAPLARRLGLEARVADEINEIDFGSWIGSPFDTLASDPRWGLYNTFRSGTRPPGGELALEVQARVVGFLLRLRDECPGETVAAVSHGDAIRSALVYFLGMPLDLGLRLEISPASVSILELSDHGPRLLVLNRTEP